MLKMIDVFEQNTVQNFKHALLHSNDLLSEQLTQSLLTASDSDLKEAFLHFFNTQDALESATALEIPLERINELKAGIALKDEMKLTDTLKVVALCLALETEVLQQIEVSDSLEDYLI